jgi:predicted metal-dependent hydrolase
MQKDLKIGDQSVPYTIKLSRRARRMRISVGSEAAVVVTLPWGFKQTYAEKFVEQKRQWILKSLDYFKKFSGRILPKASRHEYLNRRQEALALAQRKVLQWNGIYGFSHKRISIKNQKTRWGSCSKKGNLNFNYKIVHLPENLVDYLVAHELCHLKEFNHSQKFWALVGRAVPDYKKLRRQLRNFGSVFVS